MFTVATVTPDRLRPSNGDTTEFATTQFAAKLSLAMPGKFWPTVGLLRKVPANCTPNQGSVYAARPFSCVRNGV